MTHKRKGLLPKVEMIVMAVFVIAAIVIIWKKCVDNQDRFSDGEETTALQSKTESETPTDSLAADTTASLSAPSKKGPFEFEDYSRLYVTIDGLNLRKTPDLEGDVIVRLPLFEEVWFMNEVTDSTQQISLGYEIADEPWVKIKTKKGHEGWVYGAGVHYYKKKREGVLE